MGPYGDENFKMYLLLQFSSARLPKKLQPTLGAPLQNLFFGILIFRLFDFSRIFIDFPMVFNGENQNKVYLENGSP